MTDAHAGSEFEFEDIELVHRGEIHVYLFRFRGATLRVRTVANPTSRELIDALLTRAKAYLAGDKED